MNYMSYVWNITVTFTGYSSYLMMEKSSYCSMVFKRKLKRHHNQKLKKH